MCYAKTVNKTAELVNARNTNGETALHVAVKAGQTDTALVLLAEGCPCNAQSLLNGATALHEAVSRRNSRLIYALLRHGRGASIMLPDGAIRTLPSTKEESCTSPPANEVGFQVSGRPAQLIHTVVATADARVLEDLLRTEPEIVRAKDGYGYTAVLIAALRGDVRVMALLLDIGGSVDDVEFSRGRTPLHIAACQGYCDIVRLLIEYGAPVDQEDGEEARTPMHLAVLSGHGSVVELLLDGGACDSEDRAGCTAFRHAVRTKQEEMVYIFAVHYERRRIMGAIEEDELHRDGLEQQDSRGCSLLHDAVRTGSNTIVKALLRVGSRVLTQDNLGQSPTHYAATGADSVAIMSDLLHYDSRAASALDHADRTPLHIAVGTGHTDIARVILEHRPSVANDQTAGFTPLDLALAARCEELCRLLIEKGAFWNHQLFNAICNGNAILVRFLLKAIAEPLNIVSRSLPRSALVCAVLSGHVGESMMDAFSCVLLTSARHPSRLRHPSGHVVRQCAKLYP